MLNVIIFAFCFLGLTFELIPSALLLSFMVVALKYYQTPEVQNLQRGFSQKRALTKAEDIIEWKALVTLMDLDPLYSKCSLAQGCFGSRVSPKPGRVNDRIATHWKTVGTGQFDESLRPQWLAYLEAISKY